ncbi:MAG: hypothetical protein KDI36_06770 [Pseudomonadales bacterium]|nr:hypothetical protein [Pseudomonadales bacterium]
MLEDDEPVIEDDDPHTIDARQKIRSQLEADIEAFLKAGGAILEIEPNVTADPPRKPESKYGGRPI